MRGTETISHCCVAGAIILARVGWSCPSPRRRLRLNRWSGDLSASFLFFLEGNPIALVTVSDHLRVCLPVFGKTHHELRNTEVIATLYLPGVPRLSGGSDQLFHQFILCEVWQSWSFNLIDVAVPRFLLLKKRLKQLIAE
jgi:hypothetical protein